ncbi:helix-turn-helix domain-containing protein [Roseomonas sp. JC162]|uniref:Helix-turn-helix domain-containing protein n=1 Tax=Neoroseomonas marina TaxID=1232220 RepID=A0A848EI99_9PROT|nr:helix-turn-helix domain-containing protein [Neoroseomonas marina]
MEPIAVTLPEVKRLTSLSRSTIYRLAQANKIETKKVGARTLYKVDSIRDFLNGCPPANITGKL